MSSIDSYIRDNRVYAILVTEDSSYMSEKEILNDENIDDITCELFTQLVKRLRRLSRFDK